MGELKRYRSIVADSARWEGFEFRADDIIVSTPPKCGTTWTQTLCGLLIFDGDDFGRPLSEVSPWVDMQLASREDIVALLEAQQHRRFMKSHTPLDGLPFDERVTYVGVGRDPRDAAFSWWHHGGNVDEKQFMALREAAVGLDDLADFAPPTEWSDDLNERFLQWVYDDSSANTSLANLLHHLQTFWERRTLPNVALFHYSDFGRDLAGQVSRLAAALRIDVTRERAAQLAALAAFDRVKQRSAQFAPEAHHALWKDASEFFHRGTDGQWKGILDDASLDRYWERVHDLVDPDLAAWVHSGWLGSYDDKAAVTSTSTS